MMWLNLEASIAEEFAALQGAADPRTFRARVAWNIDLGSGARYNRCRIRSPATRPATNYIMKSCPECGTVFQASTRRGLRRVAQTCPAGRCKARRHERQYETTRSERSMMVVERMRLARERKSA